MGPANTNGNYNDDDSKTGNHEDYDNISLVSGGWSQWNPWTSCSLTCGDGIHSRDRLCTNPIPQHGGANCSGKTSESQTCKIVDCPGEFCGLQISGFLNDFL